MHSIRTMPLHSSPAGRRLGRAHGEMTFTSDLSRRLIRLPLFVGITADQQQLICDVLAGALRR